MSTGYFDIVYKFIKGEYVMYVCLKNKSKIYQFHLLYKITTEVMATSNEIVKKIFSNVNLTVILLTIDFSNTAYYLHFKKSRNCYYAFHTS